MEGQRPFAKWNMAAFHDGAVHHREVTAAGIALKQAGPMALALKPRQTLRHATVRAHGAIRPEHKLEVRAGRVVIVEHRVSKCGHGAIS